MNHPIISRLRAGFTRDITLLTYSMFTRRIAMGFIQVVRAIYFAILGYTPLEVGLLLSTAAFLSALHHMAFGYLCDRYGRKPFLVLGTLFSAARTTLFAVSTNFWVLALAQGLGAMGEGVGAGQPVVSGYITDRVEDRYRANVYSTLAITNGLATSIGLALGGLPKALEALGYTTVQAHQLLWWACTAINLLSLLFLTPLAESNHPRPHNPQPQSRRSTWGTIARFSLVRATNGLGWGLVDSLMTLYLYQRFNVGTEVLGPIYSATRLASLLTYAAAPTIAHRLGPVKTIAATRILSAGATLLLALANSFPLAATMLVANRILILFSMPIRQTFASTIVHPRETATAIGISNSARMAMQSAAPTIAGYMFENLSMATPFLAGAALLALNGGLYLTLFKPGGGEGGNPNQAIQASPSPGKPGNPWD